MRVGSLCSGYGGLEMGAELVLGPFEHLWHAEFDEAPSRVLAERWPGVPNLGDISKLTDGTSEYGTWADQEPIDLLCAGYPCQGESDAGLRRGEDDPRFRWPDVWAAIRALRPRLVFLENVRGHLNRSFPRVAADLSAIGYVLRWQCVRASDAGAAHRRERLFVVAWPEEEAAPWLRGVDAAVPGGELTLLPTPRTSDTNGVGRHGEGGMDLRTAVSLLPTPRARDGKGRDPNPRGVDLNEAIALLPRPTAERAGYNRGGSAGRVGPVRPSLDQVERLLPTPKASDTGTEGRRAGEGFRPPLSRVVFDQADLLLPTPRATDGAKGGPNQRGSSGDLALPAAVQPGRWGAYAPAIARWETVIGRPAPEPTTVGRGSRRQLSPRFVEWLMGLPADWVTDVLPKRTEALRVLGNGVAPQAAALALRLLLTEPERPGHVQPELFALAGGAS